MKKFFLFLGMCCWILANPPIGLCANYEMDGFNAPVGMLFAANGNLYVAEWGVNQIVEIDNNGQRKVVLSAISSPAGLVQDKAGNIYIAGYGDGRIYKWNGHDKPEVLARGFQQPTGLLWSKNDRLMVANRGAGTIEEVDPDGNRHVVSSGHVLPVGIAQTVDGYIYVSCYGGTLDRMAPDGTVTQIKAGLRTPGVGILPAGNDSVFLVDNGAGTVIEAGMNGVITTLARDLSSPVGLARDKDGKIIVATWGDGKIRILED